MNKQPEEKEPTAYEVMLKKAEQQIASIEAQEAKAHQDMASAQEEVERINQHIAGRTERLDTTRNHLQKLQQAEKQAANYAGLAEGTANEASSVLKLHELQSQVQASQEELASLEETAEQEQKAEQERLASCRETIASAEKTLQECETKRAGIEDARKQAYKLLIEEQVRDARLRLELQRAKIEATRKETAQELVNLQQLWEGIKQDCRTYPEMWGELRAEYVYNDHITHALEGAISLSKTLYEEREHLPRILPLRGTSFQQLWLRTCFCFPEEEMLDLQNGGKAMNQRTTFEEDILKRYRDQQNQL